jgi:hypothetical protein
MKEDLELGKTAAIEWELFERIAADRKARKA